MKAFYALCIVAMALLFPSKAIAVLGPDIAPDVAQAAHDPVWLALLHADSQGHSLITDKNFFLSPKGQNDPARELAASIAAFNSQDKTINQAQCRFPARLGWIEHALPQAVASLPSVKCPALDEYFYKLSAQKVSLVFATEYVPNPTTMMGHLFLKIEGHNREGNPEHSLSFFSDLNKVHSTAGFMWGALVAGTDGLYMLEPYHQRRDSYLKNGQRNIWEFEIKLSPEQVRRLAAHMWEMKGVNVAYDLKDNNCASAIMRLLMVADPAYEAALYKSFVTPADVLRKLDEAHRIAGTQFLPSDVYVMRTLGQTMSKAEIAKLKQALKQGYDISATVAMPSHNVLDKSHATSLEASFVADNHGNFLNLNLAPAYNRLMSNNDYVAQEYEVSLFGADVGISGQKDKVNIQNIDILSMKSLLPITPLDSHFSSSLEVGAENESFALESEKLFPKVFGGLGYTWSALNNTLYPYALLNGGYSFYRGNNVLSVAPEVGVIAREGVFGKAALSYTKYINTASYKYDEKLEARQTFFIHKDLNLNLTYNYADNSSSKNDSAFSVGLGVFF